VAWGPLGWEAAAFAEIAPFPSAVLAHRFPHVPNLHDFTRITDAQLGDLGPVQLLAGGTPCQSFSIAGLRQGLRDHRGNLALGFLALAVALRPQWIVWENVPGVLSSNGGRDFSAFLAGLGKCGYGWSYRVLDAQYFGVAQRRRRVFVVGCLGEQRRTAEVLFEPHGVRRHFAPRRQEGKGVTGTLEARAGGGGFDAGAHGAASGHLVPQWPAETACALQACFGAKQGLEDQHIRAGAPLFVPAPMTFDWQSGGDVRLNVSSVATSALQANQTPAVVHSICLGSDPIHSVEVAMPSTTRNGDPGVIQRGTAVRRITPTEAERLQGFPDGWTQVPYRGKPQDQCPDGPRYHALGNSMAAPVVRWIGQRIQEVEAS